MVVSMESTSAMSCTDVAFFRGKKKDFLKSKFYFMRKAGFPSSSVGKESACNTGDLDSIPGLGRSGEGNGYPLQYSGLENSVDYIVHGVPKSQTQMSDFHFM